MPAVASSAHQIAPGGHPKRGQQPAHHRETHGNFRFSARYFPKNSAPPRAPRARALGNPRKDPWPCRMRDSLFHALRGGPRGEEARSRRGMRRKASQPRSHSLRSQPAGAVDLDEPEAPASDV